MKLIIVAFAFGIISILFSSCLKSNLPAYPVSGQDYISEVYFQYRWMDSSDLANGQAVVAVQNMTVAQHIDSATSTITCQITVPAANGAFDAYQRSKVVLDSIWAYVNTSTGATVTPMGNAPKFAYQGNYAIPQQYLVTAANPDSTRVWTITVSSFIKP